ncbi:MAG: hypothetical protein ACTSV7_06680 [Candidatus Baldrarchaeia archaeon]
MNGDVYTSEQYRLRAGAPMPALGKFVLHTFKAELSDIFIYPCTTELPGSNQFRGQGGDYMSANFSRLPHIGGQLFQGKIVNAPDDIEERDF